MNELKPLDEKEVRDFLFSYLFKYPTIDTDAIIKLSIAISARFGTSAVGTGKQVFDYGELESHIATHLEQGTHIPKEDIEPAVRMIMISVRQEVKALSPARSKVDEEGIEKIVENVWCKNMGTLTTNSERFKEIAKAISAFLRGSV